MPVYAPLNAHNLLHHDVTKERQSTNSVFYLPKAFLITSPPGKPHPMYQNFPQRVLKRKNPIKALSSRMQGEGKPSRTEAVIWSALPLLLHASLSHKQGLLQKRRPLRRCSVVAQFHTPT